MPSTNQRSNFIEASRQRATAGMLTANPLGQYGTCSKCAVLCELVDRSNLCHRCIGACVKKHMRRVCSSAQPRAGAGAARVQQLVFGPTDTPEEMEQRGSSAESEPLKEVESRVAESASSADSSPSSREVSLSSMSSTDSASSTSALEAFQKACNYFSELSRQRLPTQVQ